MACCGLYGVNPGMHGVSREASVYGKGSEGSYRTVDSAPKG